VPWHDTGLSFANGKQMSRDSLVCKADKHIVEKQINIGMSLAHTCIYDV